MEREPPPRRLDEDYTLPVAGTRQDRETGLWYVGMFTRTEPAEHGPFATHEEAQAALVELMGRPDVP